MSRAKYAKTGTRTDGKQKYNSLILPSFVENSSDIVISVNNSTRLDALAQQFFNDATLWWVIAVYNNIGEPSLFVKNLTFLRIPSDIQTIFNTIKELN